MGKLFGTDGVRGKVGEYPMVPEFALKLGQAVGTYLATENRKVAICKDTRASGDMLEATLAAGLNSVGANVILAGVLPTPAMSALASGMRVDAAIIISASHNPADENGIKILTAAGDKLPANQAAKLEELIEKDDFIFDSNKIGRVEHRFDLVKDYISGVENMVSSLKGLHVVVDCANGVFSGIMPEIFKELRAGVIAIGNEPDGYNINQGCGSMHPEKMMETVVNSKAQLGIAVDGDGDRILVCDEAGNKIDGDQIIAFMAKFFRDEGKLKGNAAVTTILSNYGLEKFFKSLGIDYYQSDVGERYVIEKMREAGSNIGGEESGHIVLSDYAKSGDGLIAGLILADAVMKSGKKMSEIFPVFKAAPRKRFDVKFAKKENMDLAVNDAGVKAAIEECLREIEGKGRILVRKSGTEAKVQVWVWGEEQALVDKLNDKIAAEIGKFAS